MIIKCYRVRTRGGQRKRLVEHLLNGEDNEEVHVMQGSVRDVEDAFADALRFGREFAVRHWILSPGQEVSKDQFDSAVALLGQEFGFQPTSAVEIRHRKPRTTGAFDQHLHLLVPEIDPATGAVLSSSHNYQRNEKIARLLEHAWDHPFTSGAHNRAVIVALKREGHTELAAALEAAFPDSLPRPRQSYNTADQQRLKRAGFDLPALREIIASAWRAKTSRDQFEQQISRHGLTLERGDRPRTYVVKAASGELVGALHRLTRQRKEAVHTFMEETNVQPRKTDHLGSDLREHANSAQTTAAHLGYGREEPSAGTAEPVGESVERAGSDVRSDPTTPRRTGSAVRAAQQPEHRESGGRPAQGRAAERELAFEFSLVQHHNRLQIMLGQANALSRNHLDRAVIEVGALEERARSAAAMARTVLPEPQVVADAREAFKSASKKRDALDAPLDRIRGAERSLSQPHAWWRRAVDWITGATARKEAEKQAIAKDRRQLEAAIVEADRSVALANQALVEAESRHVAANREHRRRWTTEASEASRRLEATKAAATLWQVLPGLARLGPEGMRRVGDRILDAQTRYGRRTRHRPTVLRPQ